VASDKNSLHRLEISPLPKADAVGTFAMKSLFLLFALLACLPLTMTRAQEPAVVEADWMPLFDGKTLSGWKSNDERIDVFSVVDGAIRASGGRAHLFYVGEDLGVTFKDFELKLKVKTTRGSTSGIYFHTEYQERGWPSKGYECQIDNSGADRRKTGSLYGVVDVMRRSPARDGKWADIIIKVVGRNISITVNGKEVTKYKEPKGVKRLTAFRGRVLSEGTFALQGHSPENDVFFKDIQIREI
jgi:hypothetical protein